MNRDCNGVTHKIVDGDTLYNLSRKYGVKLADIMKENPYVNVYNLTVGDEICIPSADEGMMNDYYRVEPGDTFGIIMRKSGLSIEDIFYNNKELFDMKVPIGMILKIN